MTPLVHTDSLPAIPAGLDPAIPRLAEALDRRAVATRFAAAWPRGGSVTIEECARQHVRWTPGKDCTATYQLRVCAPPDDTMTTIGVVTVGAEGVHHRLFTTDSRLAGLPAATNPAGMRAWLAGRLAQRSDACAITPVRYRPSSRCVLRYDLTGEAGTTTLYGKLLDDDRFPGLAAILASPGELRVAALVGIAPEWRLIVQHGVGDSIAALSTVSLTGPVLAEIAASGILLSRLHALAGPAGPSRSLTQDADALTEYLPAADRVSPSSAARLAQGIERLRACTDVVDRRRPSHGAFRLDQVHVSAGGPLLIDLDSYCWAEPERDVGNLLAYMRWRELRLPESAGAMAVVRTEFLDAYRRGRGLALRSSRVAAFEAASLLKIAGRRYRSLSTDEWGKVPALIEAALHRLERAEPRHA